MSKKKVLAVTPKEEMQVGKKRKTDLLEKSNKRFKGSLKPVQPSVSFKDIGGNEKVLNEVTKLLIHLLHPEVRIVHIFFHKVYINIYMSGIGTCTFSPTFSFRF